MIYFLLILLGLTVSVLLFVQLHKETLLQNKQVRYAFQNLVLEVHCPPGAQAPVIRPAHSDPDVVYPILSTSITCGKKTDKPRFRTDLAVATSDEQLVETAAEFTIDPDGKVLKLFVRRLEQPSLLVCSEDNKTLQYIPTKLVKNPDWTPDMGRRDKYLPAEGIPMIPAEFYHPEQTFYCHKPTAKVPLSIGDKILMGNTLFVVRCDRRESP